jgi:hypothetical protein
MKRNDDMQPWSERRTRALLRLFKTQAPADFHAQVLARIDALQRSSDRLPARWADPPGRWQRWRAWVQETTQARSTGATLAIASVCLAVLGGSLVWWASQQPGSSLPPAFTDLPVADAPQAEERVTVHQERPGETTSAAEFQAEPVVPSLTPLPLQATKENPSAIQPSSNPSPAKRPVPGKVKRMKKGQGTGRHAPA